jgi:hypothetical protein
LLQKASPAANETAAIALQNLGSAVQEFRIDVDPKIVEGLRDRFPLPNEKRAIIPQGMMEGLRMARSGALFMLKDIERRLKENPGAFDLSQSLSALRDRVARMVGTP